MMIGATSQFADIFDGSTLLGPVPPMTESAPLNVLEVAMEMSLTPGLLSAIDKKFEPICGFVQLLQAAFDLTNKFCR